MAEAALPPAPAFPPLDSSIGALCVPSLPLSLYLFNRAASTDLLFRPRSLM